MSVSKQKKELSLILIQLPLGCRRREQEDHPRVQRDHSVTYFSLAGMPQSNHPAGIMGALI